MKLTLLLLEDSNDDAELVLAELEMGGYAVEVEQVYTRQGMVAALARRQDWDLIISDHNMPGFSSIDALLILINSGLDIPLIIVSGTIGEEMAVEVMKAGAKDYVMKDNLSRLGPAVKNAIESAQAKRCALDYQQRLRELGVHLESVREQERAAIARDIHDEIGGLLTALKMDVRWLARRNDGATGEITGKLDCMGEHLDRAIRCVRRIITDLRPSVLDDLGLFAALEWQLEEFRKRYGVDCRFRIDDGLKSCENCEHSITVFRIFQESLNNIAKHARATRVEVSAIRKEGALLLSVEDNGVGISEESKHKHGSYGLIGMNERAMAIGGEFRITAIEGGGTRLVLRIPCQKT